MVVGWGSEKKKRTTDKDLQILQVLKNKSIFGSDGLDLLVM